MWRGLYFIFLDAIQMLERVPEDKLSFVIQIMQGVNGLIGAPEKNDKKAIELDQFVMEATEKPQAVTIQISKKEALATRLLFLLISVVGSALGDHDCIVAYSIYDTITVIYSSTPVS